MFKRLRISTTDWSILKNILIVTPLSLVGRAGTLLIYSTLASWFGINPGMDFVYYHWAVAIFLIEILSSASAYSVLIPLLAEERAKNLTHASACVRAVFSLYTICIPALCIACAIVSYLVSRLFLPTPDLPSNVIIGIICGFAIFTMVSSVRWLLKAVLDAYQRFRLPIIIQGIRVPIVIGFIYLSKDAFGLLGIIIGLTIGECFQVATLWLVCRFSLRITGFFRVTMVRRYWQGYPKTVQFIKQFLLMMGAAIADSMNPVVDRGMAGSLGPGSVSKLDYGLKLCAIPETVTGVIMPVLLSHWSAISADADIQQLRRSVWKGVFAAIVLMGPVILGFYAFRVAIVNLIYGHGVMTQPEQLHVASILGVYLVGTLPRLISRLLIRAHLALQNTKFIFSATLLRTIFNPILNLIFIRFWGIEGIAASTALFSFPLTIYIGIGFWIASRRA